MASGSGFDKIKQLLGQIGSERAQLEAKLEKAKRRREHLELSPLPKSDFVAGLHQMIDRDADAYPERLALPLQDLIRKPWYEFSKSHINVLSYAGTDWGQGRVPPQMLAWMFRDQLKEGIRKAIEAIDDWPEPGPPLAERRAELEQLNSEIEALEQQLAELADQATKAGLKRLP